MASTLRQGTVAPEAFIRACIYSDRQGKTGSLTWAAVAVQELWR